MSSDTDSSEEELVEQLQQIIQYKEHDIKTLEDVVYNLKVLNQMLKNTNQKLREQLQRRGNPSEDNIRAYQLEIESLKQQISELTLLQHLPRKKPKKKKNEASTSGTKKE